jgi:hypothetical protein
VLNVFVAREEEERELKKRCRKLKTLKWAFPVICFAGAAKHLRSDAWSAFTCARND